MDKPQILLRTVNARGIRTDSRRKDCFDWLKGNHLKKNKAARIADINIIADTHCHFRHERDDWGKEWSNKKENSFFSLGTKNQKGVAILISDKFI